jgi:NAD(P)-dependent dehydrogenase (short-subunit alcohol dehydrogenase family)
MIDNYRQKNHSQTTLPHAALVTGASKGLGRALLLALAKRGVRVVGIARNVDALERVVQEARAAGGAAWGIAADVAAPGASTRIAVEAAALAGDLDLVVHNASTLGPVPLLPLVDVTEQDLARVMTTNVVGPLALVRATVGGMVVRGGGTQLFISSDAAVEAYPTWGPYGAAKAAVDHAARVLAAELAGSGVRVVSVDPGEMDTDMHRDAIPDADPRSLQRPDDVARRLLKIIDDAATYASGSRVRATEVLL